MAWRIADSVTKGEIDNRTRDRVTGRLWIYGRERPVELELTGNPHRDLAGQYLRFTNPDPKPIPEGMDGFAEEQSGAVGDMTAARRVKIPDIPDDQIEHYYANKISMPFHWGNCLYLEWYSARNGRVVIEATDFELAVEAEAAWEMSETEEQAQINANERAMIDFLGTLLEAEEGKEVTEPGFAEADEESDVPFPEVVEDDRPQSRAEAEADAEAARMDLLNDRIMARIEREGDVDAEAYGRIIEEERERLRRERGEPEPRWIPEEDREFVEVELRNAEVAEMFAREDEEIDDEPRDPLVERFQELGHRLREEIDEQGWLPEEFQEEHPLHELVHRVWFAGAKMAGVLNNGFHSWPPDALVAGNSLVRLKKAREYLNDALAAINSAQEEQLCPTDWLARVEPEVEQLKWEVNELIRDGRRILRDAEEE